MKGEKATFKWEPEALEAETDEVLNSADNAHKLLIKQILLGPEAVDGELNVVQVEASSVRDKVTIPIAVLKADRNPQVSVDLEFPDSPVVFTLVQGSGPVYLLGQHLEQLQDEVDLHEEDIEEEEEDEPDSDDEKIGEEAANPRKKAKLDLNHKKAKNDKGKKK